MDLMDRKNHLQKNCPKVRRTVKISQIAAGKQNTTSVFSIYVNIRVKKLAFA